MKGKLVTLFVLLGTVGLLQAGCSTCNTCCDSKPAQVKEATGSCDSCCGSIFGCNSCCGDKASKGGY